MKKTLLEVKERLQNKKAWIYATFLLVMVVGIAAIVYFDTKKEEGKNVEQAMQEVIVE